MEREGPGLESGLHSGLPALLASGSEGDVAIPAVHPPRAPLRALRSDTEGVRFSPSQQQDPRLIAPVSQLSMDSKDAQMVRLCSLDRSVSRCMLERAERDVT